MRYVNIDEINFAMQSKDSLKDIESFLDNLPRLPLYTNVNEAILYCNKGITHFEQVIAKNPNFDVIGYDPLRLIYRSKKEGALVSAIIPSLSKNVFRSVAISRSRIWDQFSRKFIKRQYPLIVPIFFKQNELERSFNKFELALGSQFRIRILDLTVRERRTLGVVESSKNHIEKKSVDTKRWWTDLSLFEVFNTAKDESLWISSFKFAIQKKQNRENSYQNVTVGRISNNGFVHFNGSYHDINQFLVSSLEFEAEDRIKLFENRGIKERNYHPSKPIQITYPFDIFSETKEIRKIGRTFSEYPNSSRIEYHCNPYYHASIADFLDGSSFDIWILTNRQLLIVPQTTSSVQAFERLTSYIFAQIGEGVIDEVSGD